jgi:hypothetical protein
MGRCLICRGENAKVEGYRGSYKITCARCGTFGMSQETFEDFKDDQRFQRLSIAQRSWLSQKIRKSQDRNRIPSWNIEKIDNCLSEYFGFNLHNQLNDAIVWIGERTEYGGHDVPVCVDDISGYCAIDNENSLYFIINCLSDSGFIKCDLVKSINGNIGTVNLTVVGWEKYNSLIVGKESQDYAFMAMKFGTEFDTVVSETFVPAVRQTGYRLVRTDERPEAGLIDIKMRQDIKLAKFVIADLTHDNNGAYWEAGFAEGIGKKVIYTCDKAKFDDFQTHFDVSHHLTIMWDPNKLEEAAENLKAAIRYTFPEAKQFD